MIKRFVIWLMRRRGVPMCHICDNTPTLNTLGGKLTCYGCEHEVMGWEHEHDARMWQLYGEDY